MRRNQSSTTELTPDCLGRPDVPNSALGGSELPEGRDRLAHGGHPVPLCACCPPATLTSESPLIRHLLDSVTFLPLPSRRL